MSGTRILPWASLSSLSKKDKHSLMLSFEPWLVLGKSELDASSVCFLVLVRTRIYHL